MSENRENNWICPCCNGRNQWSWDCESHDYCDPPEVCRDCGNIYGEIPESDEYEMYLCRNPEWECDEYEESGYTGSYYCEGCRYADYELE